MKDYGLSVENNSAQFLDFARRKIVDEDKTVDMLMRDKDVLQAAKKGTRHCIVAVRKKLMKLYNARYYYEHQEMMYEWHF